MFLTFTISGSTFAQKIFMPFDTIFFIQQQTMNYWCKNSHSEAYNFGGFTCFSFRIDKETLHYSGRFQIFTGFQYPIFTIFATFLSRMCWQIFHRIYNIKHLRHKTGSYWVKNTFKYSSSGARREEKNRFRCLLINRIKQKKKDFLKFMIYDPRLIYQRQEE